MAEQADNNLPVIVIGGWTTKRLSYRYWIERLRTSGKTVYFVNPRGTGSKRELLYRKTTKVLAYMQKHSIEEADFIGHSIGALVVVAFALENLPMVGEIKLINPIGVLDGDSVPKLALRAPKSVRADWRRARSVGTLRGYLLAGFITAFSIPLCLRLYLFREPRMMVSVDLWKMLRQLQDFSDTRITLITTEGDNLTKAHAVASDLGEGLYEFVDEWMPLPPEATHNAPIIEKASSFKEATMPEQPIGLMTVERLYGDQVEAGDSPSELHDWLINYQANSGGPGAFTDAARDFINEKLDGWYIGNPS